MEKLAHLTCVQNLSYVKLGHMASSELMASAEAARALNMPRTTFNRRVLQGLIPAAHRLPGKTGAWLFDPAVIADLAKEGTE